MDAIARSLVVALLAAATLVVTPTAQAATAWLTPEPLGATSTDITGASVAMDDDGNTISAWWRKVDGAGQVAVATRPAGGTWSAPAKVADVPSIQHSTIEAKYGPNGAAAITWIENDPAGCCFTWAVVAHRDAAGTWTTHIPQNKTTKINESHVGFDAAGNLTVAWATNGVMGAQTRSAATGVWGAAAELGGNSESVFDLDVAPNGRAIVAWTPHLPTEARPAGIGVVRVSTRSADGTWDAQPSIAYESPGTGNRDTRYANAEITNDGRAVITWMSQRYGGDWWLVNFQSTHRTSASGAWSAVTQLTPEETTRYTYPPDYNGSGSVFNVARMELDGDGEGTALWTRRNNNESEQVEARDFSFETGWEAASWFYTDLGANIDPPEIRTNEDGDAVAVFLTHGMVGPYAFRRLVTRTKAAGEAWAAATTVVSGQSITYDFPDAAIDGAGNAAVAFERVDGNNGYQRGVQAAGFDATGPKLTMTAPDGAPGQELTFSVTATDVWSMPTTTPRWTLGDGSDIKDGASIKHTYVTAGDYDVSVQASDALGNSSTSSRTVDVAVNEPPVADFTFSKNPVETSESLTLDASGSSSDAAFYSWDLGNGFSAFSADDSSISVEAPSQNGTLDVKLKVRDPQGQESVVKTKTLTVSNRKPALALGSLSFLPAAPATGEVVTFSTTAATDADGTIAKYEWDLDGNADNGYEQESTGTSVTRSFAKSFTSRDIRVRAVDDDGDVTQAVPTTLSVANRAPTAIVTPTEADVHPGTQVVLSGAGSSDEDGTIASYEWDVDGNPATGTDGFEATTAAGDKAVSFTALGDHPVRLRVRDDEDAVSPPVTATITVTEEEIAVNEHPTAHLGATPNPAKTGETVTFSADGSSDADGSLAAYEWDLDGDGGYERTTTTGSASRSYDAAGTRTVRLRVIDNGGARSAAVSVALVVTAPEPVKAEQAKTAEQPKADAPAPPPPPPAPSKLSLQPAANVALAGARRSRKIPNVVGKHVDAAREALDAIHYVDYQVDWVHASKRTGVDIGDVVDQSPEAGDGEASAPGDLLDMRLKVYAGRRDRDRDLECGLDQKAVKDLDYDLGRALIRETRCRWDEDFLLKKSVEDAQYDGASMKGDDPTAKVEVPGDVEHQGLFIFVRGWRKADHHQLDEAWKLIADGGRPTCFAVMVQDRSKSLVRNAIVTVDASDAGGEDVTVKTNEKGTAVLCATYPRSNKDVPVDVVARAPGLNGHSLVGATKIATRVLNAQKTYRNTLGQTLDKRTAKPVTVARAAGFVEFLQQAAAAIGSTLEQAGTVFAGVGSEMNRRARELADAVGKGWAEASRTHQAGPANVNPGGLIGPSAGVIAAGGGNVIAAGGGNVIAAGGGNVIAAGGGNVIAAGGGNRTARAAQAPPIDTSFNVYSLGGGSVIAAGGGNVIAAGGGNLFDRIGAWLRSFGEASVIAAGGGNVIAAGGGNVIAAGGGNVIAAGGGNVIAAGGGNVIAAGGGNVIAPGALNRSARAAQAKPPEWRLSAQGKVLTVPRGGAIVTVTPCEILLGAGQFTDCRYDVRDVAKSNVVQLDAKQDVWVLDLAE